MRACAYICRALLRRLARLANICRAVLRGLARLGHSPSRVAWTPQTRRHSPKAIFKKNVTRLDKFVRVTRESCEFGASGHCLIKNQKKLTKCNLMSISHFNYFHYDFELTL
jgi:hypothetical protein